MTYLLLFVFIELLSQPPPYADGIVHMRPFFRVGVEQRGFKGIPVCWCGNILAFQIGLRSRLMLHSFFVNSYWIME